MIADSKDAFVCLYLTVAVLTSLLLAGWLDWWWADPVAALLIVPYAEWEGLKAFRKAGQVESVGS